jgi:hypothetical protein
MMIFFQNPADEGDYISWNQRATFHCGNFDYHGSFIPHNVFTHYGKGGLNDQVFLTFEEAERAALAHFREIAVGFISGRKV